MEGETEELGLLNTRVDEEDENNDDDDDENQTSKISIAKGIAAMFVFLFLGTASRVAVQALNRAIPDFELNTMRCGFSLVCMVIYFTVKLKLPTISRDTLKPVALFALLSNLLTLFMYIALTFIPLATSECLLLTSYMTSALIVFQLVNKEIVTWEKLLAVPMCMTGVILVVQPDFVFHSSNITGTNVTKMENSTQQSDDNSHNNFLPSFLGYILAIATGLTFTLQIAMAKHYKSLFTKGDLCVTLTWSYFAGTIMSIVPMLAFEKPVFPRSMGEFLLVSIHVGGYVIMFPLFLYGSLKISGSLGSILRCTTLLFALVAQYTVLSEILPGHRNWIEVFGVVLVLIGTILSSIVEVCSKR